LGLGRRSRCPGYRLFYEGCHLHLEVRRPRTHRGEMIVPFAVLNDAETAIGGYRVIALVVAPDGTIRNRQPLDITREIQSGDRHSANLTLRDIPMHNDYIVLVLEKVVRREAPCEFGRDETERAAREALARKRQ
jgi:hypothetical protein